MTTSAITRQRLVNQQVVSPRCTTPEQLVRWMGAVQAQDYRGSLWAVGLRLPAAVESDVEKAIADRSIVRTWPMRGTLHYAPAADVRWMLRLLTPRVLARSAGRYRELGLDDADFKRARAILSRALKGGGHGLTREEAYEALRRGGVSPEGQRGIHIIGHLAQQGVLCLGARKGRQHTLVMLDEWLPAAAERPRDEALATLAQRYFASHGPATAQDFAWWSGLTMKDAQAAIAEAGSALTGETREGRRLVSAATAVPARRAGSRGPGAVLMPIWDEYLVAYKDRDAAVDHPPARQARLRTVGSALIVIDGRARGSWRRTLVPSAVRVTLDFWNPVSDEQRRLVLKAVRRYARFLGLNSEIAGTQSVRRRVT